MIYSKDGEVIPIDKGTDEDKRVVGNGLPKFTMSVTHTFRYKNLDLNLYFRGNLGYQIYDVHDLYYGLQDAAPNTNVLESAYKENRKITTGKMCIAVILYIMVIYEVGCRYIGVYLEYK